MLAVAMIPSLNTSILNAGVLPIARGGTNNGSLGTTAGGVAYMDGSKQMTTAAGTSGQPLVSAGAGVPAFSTLGISGGGTNNASLATTAGAMIYMDGSKQMSTAAGTAGQAMISAGAGVPVFGTLGISGGGTNNTSLATTAGAVVYMDGSKQMSTAAGTTGQALISAGAGVPVFGTLGVSGGGTGAGTYTANGVLLGNTTSAFNVTAAGIADQVLRIPGAGGAPVFGAIDLTKSAAVTGALPIANGGTNAATQTAAFDNLSPTTKTNKGELITTNATNNVRLAVGTNGQVLQADSAQTVGVKWATPLGVVFAGGAKTYAALKNTTVYMSPSGVDDPTATIADHAIIAPITGTCRDFYAITNTANGSGSTLAITVQKGTTLAGLADTTLAISIGTLAAAGTFSNVASTFAITAGDIIIIKLNCTNVANCASLVGTSFRCVPN